MQTTLRIDDQLYRQAKAKAGELGISLTKFLADALEKRLDELERKPTTRSVKLPVSGRAGKPMSKETLCRRIDEARLADDLNSANS